MMLSAQPDTGFMLIETGFGLLGLELAPDGPAHDREGQP